MKNASTFWASISAKYANYSITMRRRICSTAINAICAEWARRKIIFIVIFAIFA